MLQNWQLARQSDSSPAHEMVEFPVLALCIDHPDGRVLFDAGCNPKAMGPNGRWPQDFQDKFPWLAGEECFLPNRLEQLGWGPQDFAYVVLSHMHNDHCGCVEYFGKSTVIVHQDELSAAARAFVTNDNSGPNIREDTAAWMAADLTWRQVGRWEGDLDLRDGARILNFGAGHAHGMLGLHVVLKSHGGVILASDALYCADNFYPNFVPSGVVIDSVGAARTARRIHNLAVSTKSEVWFGHDMDQFSKLIHSTEGFYE